MNGYETVEGGTHVKGLEDSIDKFASRMSVLSKELNQKEQFRLPTFRSYTAILNVFINNCSWKGAVKEYLTNKEAYQLVFEGIGAKNDSWEQQIKI